MSADAKTLLGQQVADFRVEADALSETLQTLTESDWNATTSFKDWRIKDVVEHLHFGDTLGTLTLTEPDAYERLRNEAQRSSLSRLEFTRQHFGDILGSELLERWQAGYAKLCASFADADPDVRLNWVGPGMKPRMFVTARQMEAWAHGFEIYDYLGTDRVHHDRIRNIATLGVRTYGWTFQNRKEIPPGPAPHVSLVSPSGAVWEWNERQDDNMVSGDAVDFCQVVTQVRNLADVNLAVTGEPANAWMQIAQCFAGPPEAPPAPGSRAHQAGR